MKIASEHHLHGTDALRMSETVEQVHAEIRIAIQGVRWPPGAANFTIFPQSGKKRGEGNGVVPIKEAFLYNLAEMDWLPERPFPVVTQPLQRNFGPMDASKEFGSEVFCVEWETGNISSSHRAINKMCIGLLRGVLAAGILVVPSRVLARFLTDRIGNLPELEPYFELWSSVPIETGVLTVIAVEQDAESEMVARIRKGTDGRALT